MAKKIINVVYDVNDKDLDVAKKKIQDVEKETKKSEGSFQKMGATGAKAWGLVASAAAAIGLASIGKQIIDITSEFQKLGAVLTNTLGSKSQANQALKLIKDFAAQTPFSVVELTNSFVKLANQGFKPTIVELRKLGDLASSQGKAFDQLTEAIIDAQTGEFERLKEFGIRASKEGNNVTFTFKGVQTQTEFTAEAIRKYVLSLGEAQGVSGAMAAISETLGGRISNLGDSWDSLLNTIGDGNKGILAETISLISELVTEVTELVKTSSQLSEEYRNEVISQQLESAKLFADGFKDQGVALEFFAKQLERQAEVINSEYGAVVQKMIDQEKTWGEEIFGVSAEKLEQNKALEASRKALGNEYNALIQSAAAVRELAKQTDVSNKPTTIQAGLIERLEKKLQDLNTARKKAFTVQEILQFNREIKETQKELDKLLKPTDSLASTKKMFKILGDYTKQVDQDDAQRQSEQITRELEQDARRNELIIANTKDTEDEKTRILEEAADRRRKIQDELTSAAIDAAQQVLYNLILTREEDLESEQAFYEQQDILAGDNDRRKGEIALEREKKEEESRKRNLEAEKKNTIRKILIDTAANVVRSILNNGGIPLGLPFGAIAAAIGAVQVATARRYKDGEIAIDGPGTTTSDSINAKLSRGESVINAAATSKSRNLLEAINDRRIDDRILQVAANGGSQVNVFDDSRIIAAIEANKVDYAVQGYSLMRSERRGKNFKLLMKAKNQGYN